MTAEIGIGFFAVLHTFPSSMAQNFWVAINAFVVCMVVTVAVSMLSQPKPESELVGLVYSVTPHQVEDAIWYKRPAMLALVAVAVCVALNFVFF